VTVRLQPFETVRQIAGWPRKPQSQPRMSEMGQKPTSDRASRRSAWCHSGRHYLIGVLLVFNRLGGIAANKNLKQERTPWPGVSFAFVRGLGNNSVTRYAILGPETVQHNNVEGRKQFLVVTGW
jgi:hypothetical protein